MTNRAKKITELMAHTAPSSDDLLVIVDSPSSNAITKKVTVGTLLSNTAANVTISNTSVLSTKNIVVRRKETPTSSATTDTQGTMFYDDNYLYIAVANGTLKRVALTAF
jgi:hypothetical protein